MAMVIEQAHRVDRPSRDHTTNASNIRLIIDGAGDRDYDAVRINNMNMSNADVLNSIHHYLAAYVIAFRDLVQNPLLVSVNITINGAVTNIRRHRSNQLKRGLIILLNVADHLRRGLLVTKRGMIYYYCHHFGNKSKDHFVSDMKLVVNGINIPTAKLFSTEPKGLAFGSVVYQDSTSRKTIDLAHEDGGTLLKNNVITEGKFSLDTKNSNTVKRIIVVEKRSIFKLMVQLRWDLTMNALLVCSQGFPDQTTKAWVHTFRNMMGIDESDCSGVCDYNPHGWALLNSFQYAKNPIECENVFCTRLGIVVTPLLMSNFPEVGCSNRFDNSDLNTFKFLLDVSNKFADVNGKIRLSQLNKMFEGGWKNDLDSMDIEKLLSALEKTILVPMRVI